MLQDLHKKTAASSDSGSESESDSESQDASKRPTANGSASPAAKFRVATDSDSESDQGLDDDAMLRMDAQLGAAVRASLSRSGGSAKDRAAALLALQLRVAALLEDWLKKVGAVVLSCHADVTVACAQTRPLHTSADAIASSIRAATAAFWVPAWANGVGATRSVLLY